MIFTDAMLQFVFLLVNHLLNKKSYAVAVTSSIVDGRTNFDPVLPLNRKENGRCTDCTTSTTSTVSDVTLKSFELKARKKKTYHPTPLPTNKVAASKPVTQIISKGTYSPNPLPSSKVAASKPVTQIISKGSYSPTPLPSSTVAASKPVTQIISKGSLTKMPLKTPSAPSVKPPLALDTKVPSVSNAKEGDSKIVGVPSKEDKGPGDDKNKIGDSTNKASGNGETGDEDKGKEGEAPDVDPNAATGDGAADDGTTASTTPDDEGNGKDTAPADGASDSTERGSSSNSPSLKTTPKPLAPSEVSKDPPKDKQGSSDEVTKSAAPTSEPSDIFKSPTPPEDYVTIIPTSGHASETSPKGKKRARPTLNPSVKKTSPTPIPTKLPSIAGKSKPSGKGSPSPRPTGTTGATSSTDPIDEGEIASEKSALTSAKYFFYTFMACVAIVGIIYYIRRYGTQNFTLII